MHVINQRTKKMKQMRIFKVDKMQQKTKILPRLGKAFTQIHQGLYASYSLICTLIYNIELLYFTDF